MGRTAELARLVHDVLGPHGVGAYLHGSSVLGGLEQAGDMDVLVVARLGEIDRLRQR